ncbi:uncharacterized [Tachysurus ichikawai]
MLSHHQRPVRAAQAFICSRTELDAPLPQAPSLRSEDERAEWRDNAAAVGHKLTALMKGFKLAWQHQHRICDTCLENRTLRSLFPACMKARTRSSVSHASRNLKSWLHSITPQCLPRHPTPVWTIRTNAEPTTL